MAWAWGIEVTKVNLPRPKVSINMTLAMEERQAAQWAGYTPSEYNALCGHPDYVDGVHFTDSKCHVLVAYRIHKLMEAVTAQQLGKA